MRDHGSDLCVCGHGRHAHSPKGRCRICVECKCFDLCAALDQVPEPARTEREEIDDLRAGQLKLIMRIRWERDQAMKKSDELTKVLESVERTMDVGLDMLWSCIYDEARTRLARAYAIVLEGLGRKKTETKEVTPT